MASSLLRIFAAIAIVAIGVVVSPTLATDYIVGDDNGWMLNFDYQGWAQGKDFRVGDNLIFNYPQGAHNVLKVNGTEFQQCAAPATTIALITGNDVIPLLTPGRKWYMCGVGRHCATGNMKLAITVLPLLQSPAASPSTGAAPAVSPSAAAEIAISKYFSWMVGVFGIIVMIIMV
ncbi:Uclacyanin 1 [Camellia lanceoleosa]|uniref:Uclacyanin 1 n=1 Tax=Camellia lanceoleosa TaxID=1840588 RepID=A0ACC0G067_9ERIC|nr:Uclacyanin 1 [Camellia lanceoleosa]